MGRSGSAHPPGLRRARLCLEVWPEFAESLVIGAAADEHPQHRLLGEATDDRSVRAVRSRAQAAIDRIGRAWSQKVTSAVSRVALSLRGTGREASHTAAELIPAAGENCTTMRRSGFAARARSEVKRTWKPMLVALAASARMRATSSSENGLSRTSSSTGPCAAASCRLPRAVFTVCGYSLVIVCSAPAQPPRSVSASKAAGA